MKNSFLMYNKFKLRKLENRYFFNQIKIMIKYIIILTINNNTAQIYNDTAFL